MTDPVIRSLRWPGDLDGLTRMDTSFTVSRVLQVTADRSGFQLAERPVVPREKRYSLPAADLGADDSVVLVAETDRVVGVAVIRAESWNRSALLSHLYVHRPSRGAGVGARLLAAAVREAGEMDARCVRVETQTANLPALRFYERHGFALCGVDTTLYDPAESGDEAALYLSRPLPGA
jgi:ribosomal protein S18 acetylase RimI-like enzyme